MAQDTLTGRGERRETRKEEAEVKNGSFSLECCVRHKGKTFSSGSGGLYVAN